MAKKNIVTPDYLFEVSWEVCNKVGGIYTVIATKALNLKSQFKRHHILIGPDVWMDTDKNPYFTEDTHLYRGWKLAAAEEGLRVRIGTWNVPGKPVAILVDYKQFLTDQNEILGQYWKDFGVDSISGDWDYKENALFGYASGKVIESFCNYNLLNSDTAVAQFHEWQTGAGLLYLKKTNLPIATVFTTHATVMGRCIAGNGLPLYDNMESYNGDEMASRFGNVARHSLEKIAAKNADVFTTVSEITARECAQFLERPVDIVTPNGFENSFVPIPEEYDLKRKEARERLREVAGAMSGEEVAQDAIMMCIGGRYEYHNKGIDIFIDALGGLMNEGWNGREIQAFIMIPSGHNGPDRSLQSKLTNHDNEHYSTQVSHVLMSPEYDQITARFRELGLNNPIGGKVKVYFIPSYLNGDDGIFNMKYYDLLVGMDLAMFPSYYEPWGYTPLEAAAFSVPTFTTSLAGFGLWVREHYGKKHPGITVADRNDSNYGDVVEDVKERIKEIADLDSAARKAYMTNARNVADIALWENQIQYYMKAYEIALGKVSSDKGAFTKYK